jgi:hypothetical protein
MRRLWFAIHMAKEVGESMGKCKILQRKMQKKQE